jgi:hypothetical protein
MVTLINTEYPHTAVISRTATSATPPFTVTTTTIWSGAVDCQAGRGGGTGLRQDVFVSDYTIYSECIDSDLQTGDNIAVTFIVDGTPVNCTIEQWSTDDVWEEDGVHYGTTIWANIVRA